MTHPERPRPQRSDTMPPSGRPGAAGRWQPTRAGVLNSWKWTDEEFHFADGWLAFVGSNGSGKSLTASQLVTVLLDGDTSQTALSVSGRAAGTLISRHTDNRDKEDKTGVWWLEYGRSDPGIGQTEYLTTGLWLRSTGQSLLRAYFVTPGRVGHQPTLHVERNPISIESLAEQLAAASGEMFTDAPRLKPKAGAHLSAISSEGSYRHAVRTRLFDPLDEVQYDALLSVLRTLRSVRTAEKISARDMLDVLTGALPALDQGKVSEIAGAMQRIAALETQHADTVEQANKLASADRAYELYRQAIALNTASALRSADNDLDRLTRSERAAEADLAAARIAKERSQRSLQQLALDVARLDGELSASETALRDHAGAELPLREKSAQDMDVAGTASEGRSAQAECDANAAAERAENDVRAATNAQQSLAKIAVELAATAETVSAAGSLTTLLPATDRLTSSEPLDPGIDEPIVAVDELAAVPLAWIEARHCSVDNVTGALSEVQTANGIALAVAEQQRKAQDEAALRSDALNEHADKRMRIEQRIVTAIVEWQRDATLFPAVPDMLVEPDAVDERIDPGGLTLWLRSQITAIRERLDVPGHVARRDAAAGTAERSRRTATEHHLAAERARDVMREAQTRHDEQVGRDLVAAEADAKTERDAQHEQAQQIDAARRHRHTHLATQLDSTAAALDSVDNWAREVRRWRAELKHLDGAELITPAAATEHVEHLIGELAATIEHSGVDVRTGGGLALTDPSVAIAEQALETLAGYDDAPLRVALADAGRLAFARLDRGVAAAEGALSDVQARIDTVAAHLGQARQAPAPPPAPEWRTRDDGSPLWSLVDFREDVDDEVRNRVEGALLVSGLLDAVVTADGRARTGDVVLSGEVAIDGASVADVLVVEPDSPVDTTLVRRLLRSIAVDHTAGTTVRSGVLTAAAPDGYVSRHVGTTARERARLELVTELEAQLAALDTEYELARNTLEDRRRERAAAAAESQAFPTSANWLRARAEAQRAQLAARAADSKAAAMQAEADAALQAVRAGLAALSQERERALATLLAEFTTVTALAEQAQRAAETALSAALEDAELAGRATELLVEAEQAQLLADTQAQQFPTLTELTTALADEDKADRQLTTAQARVVAAAEESRTAQDRVKKAFTILNEAVDLGDGRTLPAESAALKSFVQKLTLLSDQVHSWQRTTDRTVALRAQARTALRARDEAAERARKQAEEAMTARAAAEQEQAAVAKLRELYGTAYEQLRLAHEKAAQACAAARREQDDVRQQDHNADLAAATAAGTLAGITPQRSAADDLRNQRLAQMNRLVDESIATVPDGVGVDDAGRPTNLTAALTWSRRMLEAESSGTGRDELARLLDTRRTRLEAAARSVSADLARFDRQVTLQTIPGTEWRRAVVAAPDSFGGEDLHHTVVMLQRTAAQLESDLRDDVKVTLKTSMFTALRRDIATRRAAAQDLVRQIRATLGGVRTGVARVGVKVDWKVKRDPDAERMIELVSALPSDELFEQMYEVLRQRLEDATGDTWEARVAHTFDYRVWHEWDIKVTHSSFGDGSKEEFRPMTARSNPLAPFSTGEMRLATMLPLLAAAWSMYEAPTYSGPRLLFIDEVNAAFDPQNVRKLLALLREWHFDVLSTSPEMSAMLKAEAEQVMITQVTHSGAMRVAIPWLWTGSGQPVLVADQIRTTARSA
jgi:hypothetical protein